MSQDRSRFHRGESGDKAKASMVQEKIENLLKKLISCWEPSPSHALLFPTRTENKEAGEAMESK